MTDIKKKIESMLQNEIKIMNELAIDKLIIYGNDEHSFEKQEDLDKAKGRVSALNDVLKYCF
jgi:hypothetical protein